MLEPEKMCTQAAGPTQRQEVGRDDGC